MEHVTVRWAMGSNIAFKNKSAKPHKHNSAVGQVQVRVRGLVLRNSDKSKGEWYRERGQERPLNTSPNEKGARRSLDTVLVTLSGHSGPSLPS